MIEETHPDDLLGQQGDPLEALADLGVKIEAGDLSEIPFFQRAADEFAIGDLNGDLRDTAQKFLHREGAGLRGLQQALFLGDFEALE